MASLGLIKNGHKEKLGVMPGTYPANRVNYNNNESGISATNVQDAIDELASGGGGGHVIEDNDGTDMPQEDNLQFVGVYTEDDATNDRTKVNIVREMTSAQMQSLTAEQKKGFIRTTDEPDATYGKTSASNVILESGESVEDALTPSLYLQNDYIDVYQVGKRIDVLMHPSATTTSSSGTIAQLPPPKGGRAMSNNCTYTLNSVMYDGILMVDANGLLTMMNREGTTQGARTYIRGMLTYYTD